MHKTAIFPINLVDMQPNQHQRNKSCESSQFSALFYRDTCTWACSYLLTDQNQMN